MVLGFLVGDFFSMWAIISMSLICVGGISYIFTQKSDFFGKSNHTIYIITSLFNGVQFLKGNILSPWSHFFLETTAQFWKTVDLEWLEH